MTFNDHRRHLFLLIVACTGIFLIFSGNEAAAQDTQGMAHPSSPSFTSLDKIHSKKSPYNNSRLLIKLRPEAETRKLSQDMSAVVDRGLVDVLEKQGISSLKPMFPNAVAPRANEKVNLSEGVQVPKPDLTLWYVAELPADSDSLVVADELRKSGQVLMAEPDYLWKLNDSPARPEPMDGKVESDPQPRTMSLPGPSTDPLYSDSWHLTSAKVTDAWSHLEGLGLEPGGDRDIVVAVIDTGVDYEHPDLDANIWTNTQEIPDNGIDDDSNGYVDDVHGADVIAGTGDPMDSNGHGTHVAGIIAAESNNGIGGVGVAYNVQIMAVVAAQYSGVLASSDIATAVQYAVSEGADIINMSFGGYSESQVVKDALTVAYASAVLVASAGNDGKTNERECNPISYGAVYPASYPWILGVMARRQSAAANGDYLAFFSNWDCIAKNPIEYELMAPGEDIWSTLPSNQYAAWDGTSMAAPIISGIAALVRTKFLDTNDYTTRFIMGQIAATGLERQGITWEGTTKRYHDTDALSALTDTPHPSLAYSKSYIFDTISVDPGNDGDGVVDAGETVDLGLIIRNHWGNATNVTATLAAWGEGAASPDPYVTMNIATVNYGSIGSFNEDDNGIIYDGSGAATGMQYPFRFTVSASTPNNHIISFRLTTTCNNGLDPSDGTTYTATSYFNITVQRGSSVSGEISTDTTWTSDKLWIVTGNLLVPVGITLTVEPGTKVLFKDDTKLAIWGALNAIGTKVERINFKSNLLFPSRGCWAGIEVDKRGIANMSYCDIDHAKVGIKNLTDDNNCNVRTNISYCRIREGELFGILYQWVWGLSSLNMQHSIISGISYSGLDLSSLDVDIGSTPPVEIQNNIFSNCGWDERGYTTDSPAIGFGVGVGDKGCSNFALFQYIGNTFINNALNVRSTTYCDGYEFDLTSNYWGTIDTNVIESSIADYFDTFNMAKIEYAPFLTQPSPGAPAQIVSVATDPSGQLGVGEVEFTVTFNCDMDTSTDALVAFGPDKPYTDHQITGSWQDARTWVGTFTITPLTGDGWHTIYVGNARGEADYMEVTNGYLHKFEIVTSGTAAMNLQANGGAGYVDISWSQDSFDLLAGYNVYRSDTLGGTYSRINTNLIPDKTTTYRDTDIQAGLSYYYKFTVVKTDMAESDPSNIASGSATAAIPTLTTTAVTSITTNSAQNGGNITATGGAAIASRGVCWSTSANPTISDSKTTNGSGTGTFESSITGLNPGTTYHVRAYATNSAGTAYGSDLQFTTAQAVTVPTVNTTAASDVTTTTAASGGNVTSEGGASVTAKGVCWSTHSNPTTIDIKTNNGTGAGSFTSSITGLSPGTTYHVRAYATNSQGTSYGSDVSFTTSAATPTVTTASASNVTTSSATSGGNVTSEGGASVTAKGVCWSTSANPTVSNSKTNDGTGAGSFSSPITGLSPGTTYHVRAYATNSQGTAYGSDLSFTTSAATPTVTTASASNVTTSSATSGGNVTSEGGASVTTKGVCWSTSANPTVSNNKTNNGTGIGSFTSSITGLSPGTMYHVRAYATNSEGTAYGSDVSFTTSAATPTVTTTSVTNVTTSNATSGGNVTSEGGASVTAKGVCWSTSSNPTTSNSKTNNGTGVGSFSSSITGLSAGTTYHVRAYATNSQGTAYGSDVSFTTDYGTTLYVCSDEYCGGNPNCYKTIAGAVAAAQNGAIVKVANNAFYSGDVTISNKTLTIQGGWDTSFENHTGTTWLQGAPTVSNGSLSMRDVNIVP